MINTILNLLRSDGYITVNKTLACNIGLVPATVFAELASKFNYFNNIGQLRDGYFYCTSPDLKKDTGLSKDEQTTAIKKLIKFGLIDMQVKKLKGDEAPKRYFKIISDLDNLLKYLTNIDNNDDILFKHITSVENTGKEEFPQSTLGNPLFDCGIPATNKNNSNNTYNKKGLVSQSVLNIEYMENETEGERDGRTDEQTLSQIIIKSGVDLFEDQELKDIIKNTIAELYTDTITRETIKNIQVNHLDIAINKFRDMQADKEIKNPLAYFKKCLVSAIRENGLKQLFKTF